MQDFCGFLTELGDVTAADLLSPMAEGKWSVQEVVAHIMTYDESFLLSVVLEIESGGTPRVPDPADNQSFNEKAAALGRALTKAQLLSRAATARRELVDHLQRLPLEPRRAGEQGPAVADLVELLDRDFVAHDDHHVEQVRRYLQGRGYHGFCAGAPAGPRR